MVVHKPDREKGAVYRTRNVTRTNTIKTKGKKKKKVRGHFLVSS